MAFFIPFTVECDNCKVVKTKKASSKENMNSRLINPMDVEDLKWFASGNVHFCGACKGNWPYIQESCGAEYKRENQFN
ncbi:MAG: hypothetical protein HRT95_19305 [Moritella sp.]|uniref:hypothetical protein n=1 Tax=Moritella sp. TaxID=78556 RepID=UPI001DC1D1BA|nr:hypothetical protein [Moritella sp.]MCJ8293418.1 hypothetical protein [Colwellia sp.]NQY01083.1 hypothetical protein [Flavobacteriaceae bacterium]NQZ52235.1 hypothetical protein [Moritella sp.]